MRGIATLSRQTGPVRKRAKHAAIPRLRLKNLSATPTLVEKETAVVRYGLDFLVSAKRAGNFGSSDIFFHEAPPESSLLPSIDKPAAILEPVSKLGTTG
jgi:hypothetical protein